jgi:hypothetical protein
MDALLRNIKPVLLNGRKEIMVRSNNCTCNDRMSSSPEYR